MVVRVANFANVRTWFWSIVNAVILAGLLALLPILAARELDILACSVWVSSMQAAQSVVIQNGSSGLSSRVALIISGVATFASATLILLVSIPTYWVPLWMAVAGVSFGVASGLSSVQSLAAGDARTFQVRQSIRALSVLCCGIIALIGENILLGTVSFEVLFLGLTAAVLALIAIRVRDHETIADDSEVWTYQRVLPLLFGVMASLLYRNDVNLLRGNATGAEFIPWHYALLGFSMAQGFIGLFVVNHLFSRREDARLAISRYLAARRPLIITFVALLGAGLVSLVVGSLLIPVALAVALVVSVAIQGASSLAHISGRSIVAYSAGLVGFLVLAGAIRYDLGIRVAWGLELGAILGIQILLLLGTRPRDPQRPVEASRS